jgi:hypothetical protein
LGYLRKRILFSSNFIKSFTKKKLIYRERERAEIAIEINDYEKENNKLKKEIFKIIQ